MSKWEAEVLMDWYDELLKAAHASAKENGPNRDAIKFRLVRKQIIETLASQK